LQLLQFQSYNEEKQSSTNQKMPRWVLKSPLHIMFMPYLFEVFPDATVIICHRDPCEVVPSFASLMTSLWTVFRNDTLDYEEKGEHTVQFVLKWTQRVDQVLTNKTFSTQCHSVKYEDIYRDPIGVIKSFYEKVGMNFSDEYLSILNEYIENDRRERNQIKLRNGGMLHDYSLEMYGMDRDRIEKLFEFYIKKYVK